MEGFPIDLDRLRDVIENRYPALHVVEGTTAPLLRGSLAIEHEGRELIYDFIEARDSTLRVLYEEAGF